MKIKLANIYVDDLDKALRFYTQVAGFVKKTDVSQGGIAGSPWRRLKSPMAPSCISSETTTPRPRLTSRRSSSRASPRQCSTQMTSSATTKR